MSTEATKKLATMNTIDESTDTRSAQSRPRLSLESDSAAASRPKLGHANPKSLKAPAFAAMEPTVRSVPWVSRRLNESTNHQVGESNTGWLASKGPHRIAHLFEGGILLCGHLLFQAPTRIVWPASFPVSFNVH
jgi:hypothetical protein